MSTVWQIAQRDYKFGKGKHSSLTKATYDAVANRFRSLWGKEAGWAHSVLFTADLKAFAERLVAKVEEKVESQAVEVESDGTVAVQTLIKEEVVATKRIKRELEEKETLVSEVHEKVVRRTKRNRRL